jgi:hypothetical protein
LAFSHDSAAELFVVLDSRTCAIAGTAEALLSAVVEALISE